MPIPDALIIGGGLAGSTAGILLRRMGWNVCILEKSRGPKDKVCGEFLSPGVWPMLDQLDLARPLLGACGSLVQEAHFFLAKKNPVRTRLDGGEMPPAYGLSRRVLDDLFLRKAEEEGCLILRGLEAKKFHDQGDAFEVHAVCDGGPPAQLQGRWLFYAAGSRKFEDREASQTGFKTHFRASEPDDILRLVFFHGGYFGFSGIEEGMTNLCGLVENRVLKKCGGNFNLLLGQAADQNPEFRKWLGGAIRVKDWLACPIHYGFQKNFWSRVFCLGDSFCFVEPLLGQGMTLAIASGFALSAFLHEKKISREKNPTPKLVTEYRGRLKKLYSSKFRLGHVMKFLTPRLYGRMAKGLNARLLWQPLADFACQTPAPGLLEV